tara:strand:- start:174 stop:1055 length:882 start_codon:yes stop_codon:yes gene_type:complete
MPIDWKIFTQRPYIKSLSLEEQTRLYYIANEKSIRLREQRFVDFANSNSTSQGAAGTGPTEPTFTNAFSLNFDGSDDELDTNATLSELGLPVTTVSGGSFSVSFWYNATNHVNYAPVIWSSTNYNLNDGFGISQQLNFPKLRFWVGRYAHNSVESIDLNTSQWYHIAAVFTGGSTYSLQTYVNGVPGSTTTGTTSYNINSSSTSLHIGSSGGAHVVSYPFDGKLDEVAIFNKVLTNDEIVSIYNGGVPNDITSLNPISWYRFEEGSGTTAIDLGSGGNNGTISGATYETNVPT